MVTPSTGTPASTPACMSATWSPTYAVAPTERSTDAFPAVKDYQSLKLPAVEVKVPAKLKGSKNATPDMDIGVVMAQAPDGQWQPAAYNFYPKSPDVQSRLMDLIMAAREASPQDKVMKEESKPDEKAKEKTEETQEAKNEPMRENTGETPK